MFLKVQKWSLIIIVTLFFWIKADAQYKSYTISVNGDTLNAIDKGGMKQGKWLIHVDPLRGERGYEEEGEFVNDKREGVWRKYTLQSDIIAIENYRFDGKDGKSQYFSQLGDLIREESWRAYNPDEPYDTIPVYGTGSNEIISFKIVKAEQYSVKDGNWTYYDPSTGRVLKMESYDRGHLSPGQKNTETVIDIPKNQKPKEVVEYEKKNSKKKKVKMRDGSTNH